eukprot:9244883-Pyramimonas_sp.AAC.1
MLVPDPTHTSLPPATQSRLKARAEAAAAAAAKCAAEAEAEGEGGDARSVSRAKRCVLGR